MYLKLFLGVHVSESPAFDERLWHMLQQIKCLTAFLIIVYEDLRENNKNTQRAREREKEREVAWTYHISLKMIMLCACVCMSALTFRAEFTFRYRIVSYVYEYVNGPASWS